MIMLSFVIVLLQDEFDTYRTAFHPKCALSQSISNENKRSL